mmetsp:Transcript_34360/g.88832  ORF Transcript_34360/g.88832 Transcript_34360/m.88832 type:complete len:158 (-) Transcript_34360:3018-3491(-)
MWRERATYVYVCMYVCVCMCVCRCVNGVVRRGEGAVECEEEIGCESVCVCLLYSTLRLPSFPSPILNSAHTCIHNVPFLSMSTCAPVQMPNMDGFECAEEIRKRDWLFSSTPIIGCSAGASEERCLEVGMNVFLKKPFNQRKLAEVMRRAGVVDGEE